MLPVRSDLSRLGDELTAAAARAHDARRRQRRLLSRICASAVSAVLAIAVLAPDAVGPGLRLASPAIQEDFGAVVSGPPERPPILVAREVPEILITRPPERPPVLPVLGRRDA